MTLIKHCFPLWNKMVGNSGDHFFLNLEAFTLVNMKSCTQVFHTIINRNVFLSYMRYAFEIIN